MQVLRSSSYPLRTFKIQEDCLFLDPCARIQARVKRPFFGYTKQKAEYEAGIMKSLKSLALFVITSTLFSFHPANAQSSQSGASVNPPASASPSVQRRHKHHRGNGAARKARKLAKFDSNHDGVLEPNEKAAMQAKQQKHKQKQLQKFDANHDGVLEPDEKAAAKAYRQQKRQQRLNGTH
jgi:hypothetical protein